MTNEALKTIAAELTARTGMVFTTGYIGNVSRDRDDRAWFIFGSHPGRVGTADDRWGGQATQEGLIVAANRRYEALTRWAVRISS